MYYFCGLLFFRKRVRDVGAQRIAAMLTGYGGPVTHWDRVSVPKILPRAYLLKPPPAQAVGGTPQDRPSWPGPLMCAACGADAPTQK